MGVSFDTGKGSGLFPSPRIARLEQRGQREPVGREHERRSETPPLLGCDRHRLPPAGHLKSVSVGRLRDDEDGDEMRVARQSYV
jgi:hypothetical protein